MEAVGILLLVAAVVFSAEGAACPVSIPHCYRKSTLKEEDFTCELEDRESTHGVKYILFIESRSFANAPPERVKFESRELIVHVPLEYVLTGTQSDIWVERQKDNINCSSNKTTVILKHLVKYSAPDIQKKVRSAGNLMLSWPKTEDNKGAIHEIRWKINASWQNDTFETEDNKTDTWDSYRLPLQIHSVYQVQIRRKTKQYHIWSEWSNTVDVPVEIKAPVVHWRQEKKKGRRKVTLKWDAPPPEASYSGVTYNLTLNFPCKTKNKTTKDTSYSLTAADSELRVSIIAINDVSTSPFQEIIIPPVQHLKHCHTSLSKMPKKHCLEWYKLVDGETRTSHVNTSTRATVKSIKNGMEKFVRYYYFIHTGQNRQRTTISMCPIYSEEGAPVADPQNVTVVNVTENSAVLTWVPIPVQDQHGFLLHYAIWISKGSSHMAYFEVAENQTRFLLSNLSKESSYTVYIAGRTKAGAGPNATEYFSTLAGSFFIPNSGFSKIILTVFVSGVLLLFSICFSFALKRLRRKLLPVIPRPVIPETDPCHLDHQDLKEVTEEVHNVTLLYRDDVDKPSRCLNLEQSTMLHDCRHTSDEEEEDEEDEEMVAHFINSFPNPNYKGQMLRLSEPLEVAEKSQTESNCDISTPSYRPGSVL